MSRIVTIGAAQFGPVSRAESRGDVVLRLLGLLREGHARGCDLVVFTEVALTAFFPHWYMEDPAEIDSYFENEMPGRETQLLFDEAKKLGVGFCLGYAELAEEEGQKRHFNTSILVNKRAEIVGKYRKIHLPGYDAFQPGHAYQNLEKYYFDVGNLGFRVWDAFGGRIGLCICYDRRWPETYRSLALQGAEMILLGYNTPDSNPANPGSNHLANFHNLLTMQAGAYQNCAWVVGVAKAGVEEGVSQIGQSCIIAPSGEIVAMCASLEDELIVAQCDLDQAKAYRETVFNFEENRRVEYYGKLVE
ncbi:MAG: N-carbamoyl-D-amino-acid hydrolase [Gemmatimonadetes bacterium]|nr:N-carbamoyl-D-amino-acid hydrolase [Gemmatimonadota bacterium]|tara:strand:- start:5131 stop:6042 length:912 start_codon:yes stop_codon:yes gene_type:complete